MNLPMNLEDHYILDEKLGSKGKYGGVFIARDKETGQKVSIKALAQYSPSLPEIMERLKTLNSPYVARVIDAYIDGGLLYIIREFIEGIDLKKVLTDKTIYRQTDENNFLKAGISILKGLHEVHSLGIVHRDIKPSNIVVRNQENFSDIAIIDFEQAQLFPDNSNPKSSFALIYSPPEMLLKFNHLVCPASDLYALSITLFHLIMGKTPYTDCNPEILINLQLTYPMKQPVRMADDLFSVLSKAAYKQKFALPPTRMEREKIEETLRLGIQGRYQTAQDMLNDLQHVTEVFKQVSWLTKLLN